MTKKELYKELEMMCQIIACCTDASKLEDDEKKVYDMACEYHFKDVDEHLGCMNWPNCDVAGCGPSDWI